jgi:hypothetical protein
MNEDYDMSDDAGASSESIEDIKRVNLPPPLFQEGNESEEESQEGSSPEEVFEDEVTTEDDSDTDSEEEELLYKGKSVSKKSSNGKKSKDEKSVSGKGPKGGKSTSGKKSRNLDSSSEKKSKKSSKKSGDKKSEKKRSRKEESSEEEEFEEESEEEKPPKPESRRTEVRKGASTRDSLVDYFLDPRKLRRTPMPDINEITTPTGSRTSTPAKNVSQPSSARNSLRRSPILDEIPPERRFCKKRV